MKPSRIQITLGTPTLLMQSGSYRYMNKEFVDERHHHRYEVNRDMVPCLEKANLAFVARDESGKRTEVTHLRDMGVDLAGEEDIIIQCRRNCILGSRVLILSNMKIFMRIIRIYTLSSGAR